MGSSIPPRAPESAPPTTESRSRTACQIEASPGATETPSAPEQLAMAVDKRARRAFQMLHKAVTDPPVVLRRARSLMNGRFGSELQRDVVEKSDVVLRHTPPLAPGDVVRVRTMAEIEATLDDNGRCGGMEFLPVVMAKFCGQTRTVRGRVDRFFDERNWKMLKLRDAVILDDVYCQPPREADIAWAGCARSCFLFWKEAWLERIEPPAEADADGR